MVSTVANFPTVEQTRVRNRRRVASKDISLAKTLRHACLRLVRSAKESDFLVLPFSQRPLHSRHEHVDDCRRWISILLHPPRLGSFLLNQSQPYATTAPNRSVPQMFSWCGSLPTCNIMVVFVCRYMTQGCHPGGSSPRAGDPGRRLS